MLCVLNEVFEPFQWHHNGLHEVRPPNSDRFFVTQLIGRISTDSKDLKGFYSISTASFVVWIDFSSHYDLKTLQDLHLGVPKRPYFLKARKLGDAVSRRGRLRSTSGLVLWLKLRVGESRKSCIHATRRRWRLRAMIRTDAEMASPLQGEIGWFRSKNTRNPKTRI